jgi:hypothetical protein
MKVNKLEPKFKSLLEGLSNYVPHTGEDRDLVIESRAMSVIASVNHLIRLIESEYDEEMAADLTKRLFNAARSGDEEKFRRKIRVIRESRRKVTKI